LYEIEYFILVTGS